MIVPGRGVRVLIALKPADFRKGMNGLAALVQAEIKADPFAGTVFVFRARRTDRLKLLFWDGTGLCLFAKTLEDGRVRWPKIDGDSIRLMPATIPSLDERTINTAEKTLPCCNL